MKIYTKLNESRIKYDLKFSYGCWWLRSTRTYCLTGFFVGGINWNGCVRIFYTHGYDVVEFAPVCMI